MRAAHPGSGYSRYGHFVCRLCIAALLVAVSTLSAAGESKGIVRLEELVPTEKHRQMTRTAVRSIDRYGAARLWLKDELGAQVLRHYLDAWDPERAILLLADVQEFERHRRGIGEALRSGELYFAFDLFRRVRARLEERTALAYRLLDAGFDFGRDEHLVTDARLRGWAPDWASLREHWRRRVKNDVIELYLAGHPASEIRETLRSRYARLRRRVRRVDADTVVGRILDAYARAVDRHGAYLSPHAIERLRIRAVGALEGLGVILRAEAKYAVVERIMPGGPADRSRAIGVDDRILAIGEAKDPRLTDVVGWPIVDVVERLRGPKGTAVRLLVLPAGAGSVPRTIMLVRDRIALEDQAPKGRIVRPPGFGPHGLRIGVIEIPSFYVGERNRQERGHAGTSGNVRRIIRALRAQGMDGLVLDLRRNQGGSLNQAVRTAGLFITVGPIVQVYSHGGGTRVREDPDRRIEWEGALSVLVGPRSASGSEIVASAIQDYRRGLVVGERTFGKGSAQTIVPLNGTGGEGALRLTTSRWFRVTGETIERRGVQPDLDLSWATGSDRRTETDVAGRGRLSSIAATQWTRGDLTARTLAGVGARSRNRIGESQAFRTLRDVVSDRVEFGGEDRVSLNLEDRRIRHQREDRRHRGRIRTLESMVAGDGVPAYGSGTKRLAALTDALILEEAIRITGDLARTWQTGRREPAAQERDKFNRRVPKGIKW